jgi:hypothetical protein
MTAIEQAWLVLKEWSDARGRRAPPTTARMPNKPDSSRFRLQQAQREARHKAKPDWESIIFNPNSQTQRYDEEQMRRKFEALQAQLEQQGGARNE